jgi:2-polyprenyl-3-methyl-5-hydroxy-6-metoxy-1,4-benzoquinol methylase
VSGDRGGLTRRRRVAGGVVDQSSRDLLPLYDRTYYLHGVAGHEAFRRGEGGIHALLNMQRTVALACLTPPASVVDIGSGRGELARHLVDRSVGVTLVDYAPAAMEIARRFVGEHPRARYLNVSATELDTHIELASQDALFMVDFAEHVSRDELRRTLEACRRVMRPGAVLCLHSPEYTSGAVLTTSALEERHINLMDVGDLRDLLSETFAHVEAFTWNGCQRFGEPGRCIELFGIASMQPLYRPTPLEPERRPGGALAVDLRAAADSRPFLLTAELEHTEPVRGTVVPTGGSDRATPFTLEPSGNCRSSLLFAPLAGPDHASRPSRLELEPARDDRLRVVSGPTVLAR